MRVLGLLLGLTVAGTVWSCGSSEPERTGSDCPATLGDLQKENERSSCGATAKLVCQYRVDATCYAYSCAACNGEGDVRWCSAATVNEAACNPKEFR